MSSGGDDSVDSPAAVEYCDPDGVLFLEVEYVRVVTASTLGNVSSTALELFKSDTVATLKQVIFKC